MPKHWWLIEGDNPGPKERDDEVKRIARDHEGSVLFVGCDPSTGDWYALVDVKDVKDRRKLGTDLRSRKDAIVLLDADELEEKRKKEKG